jgi:hypothetical protein
MADPILLLQFELGKRSAIRQLKNRVIAEAMLPSRGRRNPAVQDSFEEMQAILGPQSDNRPKESHASVFGSPLELGEQFLPIAFIGRAGA